MRILAGSRCQIKSVSIESICPYLFLPKLEAVYTVEPVAVLVVVNVGDDTYPKVEVFGNIPRFW